MSSEVTSFECQIPRRLTKKNARFDNHNRLIFNRSLFTFR